MRPKDPIEKNERERESEAESERFSKIAQHSTETTGKHRTNRSSDLLRLSRCYDHIVRNQIFLQRKNFPLCHTKKIPKIPLVISRGCDCRQNRTNWETVYILNVCVCRWSPLVAKEWQKVWTKWHHLATQEMYAEKVFKVGDGWWTKEID